VSGRKFDKIAHSIPLWMQLLIVLLATLLLIQPRYIDNQSTQRIAIVVDSSASMSVFKEKVKNKILEQISITQGNASNVLLDSDLSKDRVYHGDSVEELELAIEAWQPSAGTSNPHHTLRVARSLSGHDGVLLYITDTPVRSIPYNAAVHAIGEVKDNVGFTGVSFDSTSGSLVWKASIRNYSLNPVVTNWTLTTDQGEQTSPREISLAAGELKVITGPFPEGRDRIQLELSEDVFTYDNILPMVIPAAKILEVYTTCNEQLTPIADKIVSNFEGLNSQSNEQFADLTIQSKSAEVKKFGTNPSIIFLDSQGSSSDYLAEPVVSTDDVLTEGLNWSSLLVSKEKRFELTKWDRPLVWVGEEPIIFVREVLIGLSESNKQLVLNFNLLESNAEQQEAIAIMFYRFLNKQRKAKSSLQRQMTELDQPIELSIDQEGSNTVIEYRDLSGKVAELHEFDPKQPVKAPSRVGFYSVRQGEDYLLHASNFYADTREADLRACDEGVLKAVKEGVAVDVSSEDDSLWRVWTLLILAALCTAWYYGKEPKLS